MASPSHSKLMTTVIVNSSLLWKSLQFKDPDQSGLASQQRREAPASSHGAGVEQAQESSTGSLPCPSQGHKM